MPNNSNMRALVRNLLSAQLPSYYYYHNLEHTLYVAEQAIVIGRAEGCSTHELEMLEAAALWHDTGFIKEREEHEMYSCLFAREYLPGFQYNSAEIDAVCSLIMVTRLPETPINKTQMVLADADLEYLGGPDVVEKAANLYRELHHFDPTLTPARWNDSQVSFLVKHHYYTAFCRENREPSKRAYLQALLNGIE